MVDKKKLEHLEGIVWKYYKENGRHTLPWRKTKNPYRILVSEVMLQQTQVARVTMKYKEFVRQFPTLHTLAQASLRDVLVAWQGLGYNRRAKLLHELAKRVVKDYRGCIPKTAQELMELPGIGLYTSSAVCVFAYNTPFPLIETNVRTVLFHHFFRERDKVSDSELLPIVEKILNREKPREWYWALMDYGAYLKAQGIKMNSKSVHYVKQSAFKGSSREVRGAIVRALSHTQGVSEKTLCINLCMDSKVVYTQLKNLKREAIVRNEGRLWFL